MLYKMYKAGNQDFDYGEVVEDKNRVHIPNTGVPGTSQHSRHVRSVSRNCKVGFYTS